MITEDYISFETAKLLKEKGFDGKCSRIWAKEENESPLRIAMSLFVEGEEVADRETVEKATSYNNKYKFRTSVMGYLCPTLQMTMKWLREVHNIDIDIQSYWKIKPKYHIHGYKYRLHYNNAPNHDINQSFNSYEQACEAAIKYCLKNLI